MRSRIRAQSGRRSNGRRQYIPPLGPVEYVVFNLLAVLIALTNILCGLAIDCVLGYIIVYVMVRSLDRAIDYVNPTGL